MQGSPRSASNPTAELRDTTSRLPDLIVMESMKWECLKR